MYKQNTKMDKISFPRTGYFGIPKMYRTLTVNAAKVQNALLLNRIKPQVEKIL